jgi:protein-tyrosine kinase
VQKAYARCASATFTIHLPFLPTRASAQVWFALHDEWGASRGCFGWEAGKQFMKSVIIAADYVQDIQASSSPPMSAREARDATDVLAKVPVRDDEMLSLFRALQMLLPEKQHWTLGIVSTLPGEGASTIARGLARTVACTPNAKVLICDVAGGDRRNRRDRRERDARGSTRASIGDGEGRIDFTWLPGSHQVAVGTFGDSAGMNALAADMDRVRSMVSSVSAGFELVILDLPPVNGSVIGPALAKAVDGVILVVEAERTRAQSVRATHKTLEMYGANVLGVVMNKRRFHIPSFIYRHL